MLQRVYVKHYASFLSIGRRKGSEDQLYFLLMWSRSYTTGTRVSAGVNRKLCKCHYEVAKLFASHAESTLQLLCHPTTILQSTYQTIE